MTTGTSRENCYNPNFYTENTKQETSKSVPIVSFPAHDTS